MADKFEDIRGVLQGLYEKHDSIEACMVVKKGLEGVVVFPTDFIDNVSSKWEPMKETIDSILGIVSEESAYGIEKAYIELLGYSIVFYAIGASDTALVTFFSCRKDAEMMADIAPKLGDIKAARDRILAIAES